MKQQAKSDIYSYLSYLIIFLFFLNLVWSSTTPWFSSSFTYSHSSTRVLIAGKQFDNHGFWASKFLPIWQPGKVYPGHEKHYTHYPPLSDLLNGLLRRLGFNSLIAFRFPPIIFAAFAAFFWFLFLRTLYNSKAAFLCLLFLVILPEFYAGSNATYYFSLDQLIRFLAIYVTHLIFKGNPENKIKHYISLWLLMFIQSMNSFDYVVYLQLFAWGYAFLFDEIKKEAKNLLWLATAPALGLFLHLLQNIWALGLERMVTDIFGAFFLRSGVKGGGGAYLTLLFKTFKMLLWRLSSMFGLDNPNTAIFLIIIIVITVASIFELRKNNEINYFGRYLLLFLFCDIFWFFAFPQHSLIHSYPIRSLLPTITFFVGIITYVNVEKFKKQWQSGNTFMQLLSIIIVSMFSMFYGYNLSRLSIIVHKHLTASSVEYEYRNLKNHLSDDAVCFTNFKKDACLIRYYLDRRTYFQDTLSGFTGLMNFLANTPFYKKDNFYYVSFSHRDIEPGLKRYLFNNAEIVYQYKLASIYKIVRGGRKAGIVN